MAGHRTLHFSVAFAEGAARAVDGRRAFQALVDRAARLGRVPLPSSAVLDAQLVISELLTNAILHAPGPCGLVLELSDTDLSVTVWDTSREQPAAQPPDRQRVGGHGLHLVRALSDRFVTAARPAGKQVTAWVRLVPDQPRPGQAGPAPESS
ncbi:MULTISPECIES: ATP-binding protein [unclassified Streptomyces]|uniref:ATP-binding protein n=1 Tax=unclassified Streptomyces TaxID=2593676 RepID=UPI002252B2B4|nr:MULTISPECIES: ATP-binding protein [unclassified Streptomyces]MCX4885549.1 ATP-binding protein [Streptomyces sp. NBC_00847]MCX5425413.1 ATP-binding protein [Streptomyces sp. NBC_00078]